jgi:cyclic beta-1,2-glucan synthetase
VRRRILRSVRPFGAAIYLISIVILTVGGLTIGAEVLLYAGISPRITTLLLAAITIPWLSMATNIVNFLAWIILYPPQKLPRLVFRQGIPDEYRTLVATPAILHSLDDVGNLLGVMELNYLSNRDPNIRFAALTDFADAPQQQMPGDAALFEALAGGVRRLNERYGSAKGTPFSLLHRDREWNAREDIWMGWERKRGKLAELNRIVLAERPRLLAICLGDAETLRTVRYVIALDAGTRLPMSAAERLIATFAHPLNVAGAGSRGFTMLQPRIRKWSGVRSASAFSFRMHQPNTILDYHQDVHHLLFGRSLYCGKAIYDVRTFEDSLRGRLPQNAILSHDHLEGMHGRVGVALDVIISDESPANPLTQMRQMHRWTRGDWQTLPWLLTRVRSESGKRVRSPLTIIDRWWILENLRSSLLSIATASSFAAGWLLIPQYAWAWTIAVLTVYGHQIGLVPLAGPTRALLGKISWRAVGGEALRRLRQQTQRLAYQLTVLVYHASAAADAIVRTLYRLTVSRKNLLEWTSSAQTERSTHLSATVMLREFSACIAVTAAIGAAVAVGSPRSFPVAMPFLLLWLTSPLLVCWIARPGDEPTVDGQERHPVV